MDNNSNDAPENRPALFSMCAEDIMQRHLVAVRASDPLEQVERSLSEAGVSGAPVVDTAGKLLGVISVRDLLRHRAEDSELPAGTDSGVFDDAVDDSEQVAFDRPAAGACAADVMTAELVSVAPTMPIAEVAGRMVETNVHRVLVIDRDKLVGIVSTMDLLGALAGQA